MLLYQRKLEKLYGSHGSSIPFCVRGGCDSNWEKYTLIHVFVVSKNLSIQDGDDLIDLLNSVYPSTTQAGMLPKNYITIHQANGIVGANLRILKEVKLPISAEYFGSTNLGGRILRPFVGVHFNILERIAEVLLFSDPSHFFPHFNH